MEKNVYMIRHGESAFNAVKMHQDAAVPLSDLGRQHAIEYAKRLGGFPIRRIIASPFVRAQQTSEPIAAALSLPVETSALFVEIKRPTEFEGKSFGDPRVVEIKKLMDEHYHDPNHRYADEETFFDLSARARKAMAFIDAMEEESILVVTHGDFLKMFAAVVLFGDALEPRKYLAMRPRIVTSHTGITHFARESGEWRMKAWNG